MTSSDSPAQWHRPDALPEIPADLVEQLVVHEQTFGAAAHLTTRPASVGRRPPEKAALLRVRRNQTTFSQLEREALRAAFTVMLEDETCARLERIRRSAAPGAIRSPGAVDLHRFLPWHRRYLWEFETRLQWIDCRLRPDQLPLALPYWHWPDRPPDWLLESPARPELAALRPSAGDVDLILHGYAGQLPGAQVSDFIRFTCGLEGWGRRPDGSRLPGHHQVLGWLESLPSEHGATAQLLFWLHLAQVDRLWSLWQQAHPGVGPALLGADRVLDPWPETVDDMSRPLAIGYTYDA